MARFTVGLSLALFIASCALAQNDPGPGILPFSTQGVGNVDLATGHVQVSIPLRSLTGYSASLQYTSYVYTTISGSNAYWNYPSLLPWKIADRTTTTVPLTEATGGNCAGSGVYYKNTATAVVDPTGAAHGLASPFVWYTGNCNVSTSVSPVTTTSGGYTIVMVSGVISLWGKDGSTMAMTCYTARNGYCFSPALTDADGNSTSWNPYAPNQGTNGTVTSVLGTTPLSATYNSDGTLSSVYYDDAGGTQRNYTLTYSSTPVETNFSCSGIIDITAGNTYSRIFGLNGRTEVQFQGNTWMLSELYIGSTGDYLGNYSNNTTYFAHSDQVRTRRRYTDPNGNIVQTCTSLPFGDGSTCTGTSTASITAFTGQDWDPATYLTRFPMRNYSTTQGRWMHPDPAGLKAVSLTNPQTWNRYAYVMNNPGGAVDPSGLCVICRVPPPSACQICSDSFGDSFLAFGEDAVLFGNDIFDAIRGEAGTFLYTDIHGNMGFGFDVSLWSATNNFIDALRSGQGTVSDKITLPSGQTIVGGTRSTSYDVSAAGWVVDVHDLGTETIVSGLIPDYVTLAQNAQWALNSLPSDVRAEIQQAIANGQNSLGGAIWMTEDPEGFQHLTNQMWRLFEQLPITNANVTFQVGPI